LQRQAARGRADNNFIKKENYMRHGVAATAKQQSQVPAYGEEAPPRMMNDKKTE
jgi:hypothetical protein